MSHDRSTQALALWQRFPENDLSRFNLAQAYVDANDYAPAVEHLRALCGKKPDGWSRIFNRQIVNHPRPFD